MKERLIKLLLFVFFGAIAGFAYYYYIGCNKGHCIISSNPYISTGYGMAAGFLLGWDSKKSRKSDKTKI